jgi:hypothetical protein
MRRPRSAKALAILAGLSLLSACTFLSVQRFDNDFDGLNSAIVRAASVGGTLRVLIVHGMGRHQPGENTVLVTGIASRLGLAASGATSTSPIDYNGHHFGQVDVSDYEGGAGKKMRIYELTWSPTTEKLKTKQFETDLDPAHVADRVAVNRSLKEKLMDDALSDPVLYIGRFRKHMQFPIMRGVRAVLRDFELTDEIAIISKSLGSYMTYDTLLKMSRGERILEEPTYSADLVRAAIGRTNYVYMLANQLPLLQLSEVSNPLSEKRAPVESLGELGRIRMKNKPKARPQGVPVALHLVAFSDPNDLLTYPLDPSDVTSSVVYSNVIITVERNAILGVFAWPMTAHGGHDKSKRVMNLLAFGHHAN